MKAPILPRGSVVFSVRGLGPVCLALVLVGLLVASCTTPGQSYVSKHAELSAAHRQILATGKIPSGEAVAGMTHEQVRLAMNGAPATFDKINGEEAWIYLRKNTVVTDTIEPPRAAAGSSLDNHEPFSSPASTGLETDGMVKTTIFFQGDRATHADVSKEKH
jgi:outer membrane protein assembly factor BamE (lipoprotein component of BamABCDE complex)